MKLWQSMLLLFLLATASCDTAVKPVSFYGPNDIPDRLSGWRLFLVDKNLLRLNDRVVPYELNTPLFSDYALKLRTVWMPPETTATYRSDREFDFPVGTIISKTFHYVRRNGRPRRKHTLQAR